MRERYMNLRGERNDEREGQVGPTPHIYFPTRDNHHEMGPRGGRLFFPSFAG